MSIFTDIFVKPPKSSRFNLSHDVSLTTDFGKLIPIYLEDVVPGDRFKVSTEMIIKMLPTLAPIMSGIEVRVDYFFVPNRLIWNDWQTFITGGDDGLSEPVVPTIDWGDLALNHDIVDIGSLFDYFGLPAYIPANARGNNSALLIDSNVAAQISALPFRAYNLIFNEYYRDENLQTEATISKGSGPDSTTDVDLLYRGLKKDYFTSALPWAQRGPQVDIPLTGSAPLVSDIEVGDNLRTVDNNDYHAASGSSLLDTRRQVYLTGSTSDHQYLVKNEGGEIGDVTAWHNHNLAASDIKDYFEDHFTADLSNSSAITINELRRLNAVQRWFEKNARAGSRYVEQILSHFGVRTPDYRLDRPEYLGGNKSIIGFNEVYQTSESNGSPQGNRAGVGFGASLNKSRKYRCAEHGWIMGIMSIIPQRNVYADGVERKWTRMDKFDYFFPSFQYLGEQSIKNKEIFGYGNQPEKDFGYTPRYAEYRYHPSKVCGEMRTSMSYWHLGRLFNTQPTLSESLINSLYALGQYDRIFPTDEHLGDRFIVQLRNHVYARRPMAKNPNPSL